MKQTLRIFSKDVRHFWPEILVSLTLAAMLVRPYPLEWWDRIGGIWLPHAASVLLGVSWCLLIARVFHAESLVGDRQFWLTRPYARRSLLAAKLLFLAAFLYAPLVMAQCLLLRAIGLHPLSSMHEMLFNLLLISGIVVAPLVAITVVTSGFASTIVTVLAVLAGSVILYSLQLRNDLSAGLSEWRPFNLPWLSWLAPFLLLVCCAVLVVQYGFRRVWAARSILIGTLIVLVAAGLLGIARPRSDEARIARDFPLTPAGSPGTLQLSLGPAEQAQSQAREFRHRETNQDWVAFAGWLRLSPRAEGTVIDADQLKVTFETSDGYRLSGVERAPGIPHAIPNRILAGAEQMYYVLYMPRAVYKRLQSNPVTVHYSLAYTESTPDKVFRFPLPKDAVAVPGLGVCSHWEKWPVLNCISAFREPTLTYSDAEWSDKPCSPSQTEVETATSGGWRGSIDSPPPDIDFVPIASWHFSLPDRSEKRWSMERKMDVPQKHLCTGNRVTVTQYKLVRRTQSRLTIQNFHLPELQ